MRPMMMLNRRNEAVISGNHHHRVGTPMPRSSHGMTPYIITPKASPNTHQDRLVLAGHHLDAHRSPRRR